MSPCVRCLSALEVGDLRCPVCSLPRPRAGVAEAVTTRVLRCTECHAVLRYSEEVAKAVCGFCGASLELEMSTDPIEHAEAWVPFTVSREKAITSLKLWLTKRGPFAPADLAKSSRVQALQAIAWSAWVVTGLCEATYGTDVFGEGRKAPWGPAAGTFSRLLNLVIPATRGLKLEEVVDLGDYDVAPARVAPLPGVAGEDFGVTRSSARGLILEGVRNDAIAEPSLRMKGKKLRRTKVEVMLTGLITRRLLLPAWVMAYRYGNKKFRVIIHGQRPWVVVGTSPISLWRVAATVNATVGLVVALLTFLILYQRFH